MMFDEQPDGDPHGECAAEIHKLEGQLGMHQQALLQVRRALGLGLHSTDDLVEVAQRMRAALDWYGDEARALAKHMQDGAHTQGVLASLTVLSLDGGMRAHGPNVSCLISQARGVDQK